jgi:hypothetical protein
VGDAPRKVAGGVKSGLRKAVDGAEKAGKAFGRAVTGKGKQADAKKADAKKAEASSG